MHFSGRPTPGRRSYQVAISDFYRARAQASLQELVGRLQGKPVSLLSYDDVSEQLQVTGRTDGGRRAIPLEAIVGSVGRYNDFTRTFLPRMDAGAQRWARVRAAARDVSELPAITVYQIGDAYFILDGNHRVSVARQQGLSHIDAAVIEVRTRVPLSAADDPDTLIIKAEQAAFLAHTKLDVLRPDSTLRVSAPGQYAHLENHIEAYRYHLEEAEDRALTDEEAALRWHDEAYVPVVEAIREQGILRFFPGRTETDLYIWIATHQLILRNQLGWPVRPDVVANHVIGALEPDRWQRVARLRDRLRRLLPGRHAPLPARSWIQERLLVRYSSALFADVLAPFRAEEAHEEALQQALLLASREGAHVHGLQLYTPDLDADGGESMAPETTFCHACDEAGVEASLARESGVPWQLICRRSVLADLVVMPYEEETLHRLLRQCRRPILVVPRQRSALRSVLLVYDGGPRAREALFAATYMAEAWGATLTIALVRHHFWQRITTYVRKYLALHEVGATFVEVGDVRAATIVRLAQEHDCDLIAMAALRAGRRWPRDYQLAVQVMRDTPQPVLIFT